MPTKKLILWGAIALVCSAGILAVILGMGSAKPDPVANTYYNNTYGFSISIPEAIASADYRVFESTRGIVAFEKKDGTRFF